jgi:hypothetical protein
MVESEYNSEITNRGFSLIEFRDYYEHKCTLQESSLATEEAIWLGCNQGSHYDERVQVVEIPGRVDSCLARMHLTRPQVKWLIKQLRQWLKTRRVELVE